jgi:hypothetical protein
MQEYTDRALHVCKGPDFSIELSIPTPAGTATARLPLSETQRLVAELSRYAAEQSEAMQQQLARWVAGG